MTAPLVSVVVCTRNRAAKLQNCLDALAAVESAHPWELVVVDNASTDDTPAVLARARESFPVPLRVVDEATPGVARARNKGWKAAAGLVAYTDDDCYVGPDFVDRIAARFGSDASLGFLGGQIVRHDPRDNKLATITRAEPLRVSAGAFIAPGTFMTSNLAVRRDALEMIGGFDQAFEYLDGGFSCEDADLVARLTAAGWQGLFDPDLVVRHDHGRRSPEEVDAVLHMYDVGRGAFYAKCLLDPRLRLVYLKGWGRLTVERVAQGERPGALLGEVSGAGRFLAARLRS